MDKKLAELIRFRGDRLFNGAVNINWFGTDKDKCQTASQSFVFHGPQYHGVAQEDVGTGHGHRLMDTASFARSIVRRCYGQEDQSFTLAIAGYGTGKSHLGLTLASLLAQAEPNTTESILSALSSADAAIGSEVRAILQEARQPCLVLGLNGMQSFDLTAEITKQIAIELRSRGLDLTPIDNLRPRFSQAASLIRMSNDAVIKELLVACEANALEDIFTGLNQQEESVYLKVHDFFAARGMTIRALGGESVRDIIDVTVREYCGKGKPYRSLVVLFDEFGRYTEFATVRSQIAGSGALQDLFEAVQAYTGLACFVGFIQFELSAYVQRIAPEYRNEILRYVTRYQGANRVYLSINLETLIASLLEKRHPKLLDARFDTVQATRESEDARDELTRWFPESGKHRLWGNPNQFHTVIRKGCWPLSPFATWFLFYLAAAGKHLQERSALALLGDVIERHDGAKVPANDNWALSPVDLWSNSLQQELLTSEESGQQGSITHAFASVIARHGSKLSGDLDRMLRAVVLASKMGLQSKDVDDAVEALAELAGIPLLDGEKAVSLLREEFNVLEWDEAFKSFDILGDAVPRTQFLAFVRARVASSYDEDGKARLFASKAATWCDLLIDFECDFAEENKITTREWRYQSECASLEMLQQQVKFAIQRWKGAIGVDDPRGTVFYCYVEPNRNPEAIVTTAMRLIRAASKELGVAGIPILVVLLCDENRELGQALAEMAVLEDSLSEAERLRFGNLIAAHQEKLKQVIRDQVESMIKQRRYSSGLLEVIESSRLLRAGSELFTKVYKSPISFPFDGFSTAKGNAADTCQELTLELLIGKLDYEGVIAKPVKSKNRAVTVLVEKWGIFTTRGDVSRRPSYSTLRLITERWDEALASGNRQLVVADVLRQLCLPPHGANIASAGLVLGVFVAPRVEKLAVVKNGQQMSVSQWVQSGFTKGKFLDLPALEGVSLISIGEASAEWETLLEEWEQAANYLARRDCAQRAMELEKRIPVPPALAYRETHLRDHARIAIETIAQMESDLDNAASKVDQGEQRRDASLLSWGASSLRSLLTRMKDEGAVWTEAQLNEIQPQFERARQSTLLHFKTWLQLQRPKGDSPEAIGDFKHRMVRLTGGNLKKIGLDALVVELETHVNNLIRQAETVAAANQLLRDVNSWITTHSDATRIVRVADLRTLREGGKELAARLVGMSERISLVEIGEARTKLAAFLNQLKELENSSVKRATALWQTQLTSEDHIERIGAEVESLVGVFENLPKDQEDLFLMRRALRLYQKDFQQLSDERLTWSEFEKLAEQLQLDADKTFAEEEIPWPPDEAIVGFVEIITRRRKEGSITWINAIEIEASTVATMGVTEANRLHSKAKNPPSILTDAHLKKLKKIDRELEARLDMLAVEWLIEKFHALSTPGRKKFLKAIGNEDSD